MRQVTHRSRRILLAGLITAISLAVHLVRAAPRNTGNLTLAQQSCLAAAKAALGPEAVILKCGHLTDPAVLEAVAVVRLKQFQVTADGVPVSKLAILRRQKSRWVTEMFAGKDWLRNSEGYLSDIPPDATDLARFCASKAKNSTGYRVSLSRTRSDAAAAFTIWLYVLSPMGENAGTPYEIGWNPSAGRFQDFAYGQDPGGFRPEIKCP